MTRVCVRGVVALALLAAMAARADAEGGKPIDDAMDASLGLVYATSRTDTTSVGTIASSAYGIEARVSGSLRATLGSMPYPGPGLRIEDWWSVNLGTGYVDAGNGGWMDFRLEATLRAIYMFHPEFEMFTRFGYLTGTSDTSGSFRGYDALFLTGGGRLGRLHGEAGLGVNGTDDRSYYYLLGSVEYRASTVGFFQYVGLRAEAFPSRNDSNEDDLMILVTAGSH